ncbi:MAG: hypothetical protein ACNYPH_05820 [Gammaproteobacteria bacterium WSBS_2016_MAG_OTU1]
MKPQIIIYGKEHAHEFYDKNGKTYDITKHREWLNKRTNHTKILGLHLKGDRFTPGNFIGMVWIGEGENKAVLRVDSKFPTMNYIKMFAECVADPDIDECSNCLHFWAEEDLINVDYAATIMIFCYLLQLHFCAN